MTTRAVWIGRTDSGVVRARLYDHAINYLGYSPLDPGAKVHMDAVRTEKRIPFLYSDPHWYGLAGDGSALKYREKLDADCARLLQPGEPLMVDLEQVSMEYVRRLVNGAPGNRGLIGSNNPSFLAGTQAGRPLWYTNEPFKDGTVVPIDVLRLVPGLRWFPQLYYGNMDPADAAAVVLEVAQWGFPATQVLPFYDGTRIASDQRDGCYFVAERIPGVFSATPTLAFAALRGEITKDSLRVHYSHLAEAA
jgi:hypothetical protein